MSRGLLSRAWIAALKTLCARFPFSHGQFLASDTGKGPDSGKIDLVFATFARRNNVSDNCQCERDQSSTPSPWMARAPINANELGAKAHPIDPRIKIPRLNNITVRRPRRSANLP